MAQRELDEEMISEEENIEKRKKKLHIDLKLKLLDEISPELDWYKRMMVKAEEHLSTVEIIECKKDAFALFDTLERKGKICPGHYSALRDLFDNLNGAAVRIIDDYAKQFEQLIKLKGKEKSLKRRDDTDTDTEHQIPRKKIKCTETEFMSDELKQAVESTRCIIDEHASDKTFIKTDAVESGKNVLKQGNILIYSGGSGTGKRKNALEILRWLRDEWDVNKEYTIIGLSSLYEWKGLVDVTSKMVVFLDNLLNEGTKYSDIEDIAHSICSCTSTGDIIFIATLHSGDYSLHEGELEKLELFQENHICDLSAEKNKLSISEKTAILHSHLEKHGLKLPNPLETQKIMKSSNEFRVFCEKQIMENYAKSPPLSEGYPRTCYLFCNKYFDIGFNFFLHPNKYIIKGYHNMSKSDCPIENTKYCILLLVMKNGPIRYHLNDILAKVKHVASEFQFKDPALPQVSLAISSLTKNVLNLSHNGFLDFQHEYIYKAVCISYGSYFPGEILKICTSKFFYELIRTYNCSFTFENEKDRMLIIPENEFNSISSRIIDELREGNLLEVVSHPIMRDELFIDDFLENQKSTQPFLHLLEKKYTPYVLYFDGKPYSVDRFFDVCCIYGYCSLAKRLLNFKLDFTEGFRLACERGHVEIASAIVEQYDRLSNDTITGICFNACSVGNIKTVQFLKTKFSGLFFQKYKRKGTPVEQALINKHKEIVESLLEGKVKINPTCSEMIYQHCIKNDWKEMCDFIEKAYKITSSGKTEQTISNNKSSVDGDSDVSNSSVRKTKGKRFYSRKINTKMNNDLQKKRCSEVIPLLIKEGLEGEIEQLLKSNSKSLNKSNMFNEISENGMTPLLNAADMKRPSIVERLLKIDSIDISVTANDGDTLLHYCARYNWSDIVRILTKRKDFETLLNTKGFNGQTPVIVAASCGSENVIYLLLRQKQIDLSLQDNDNDTFLHKCAWYGLAGVLKKCLTKLTHEYRSSLLNIYGNFDYTVIMCAAIRQHKDVVEFLLKKLSTGTTVIDQDGHNLIYYCYLNRWSDLICSVIKHVYVNFQRCEIEASCSFKSTFKRLFCSEGFVICFRFAEKHAHIELTITTPENKGIVLCRTNKGWNDAFDSILRKHCSRNWVLVNKEEESNVLLLRAVSKPKKVMKVLANDEINKGIEVEYTSLFYLCLKEGWKDISVIMFKHIFHLLQDREPLNVSNEVEYEIMKYFTQNYQYVYDMYIEYLQNTKIDTFSQYVNNESILLKSCYNGIKDIVKELVSNGKVDITCIDKDGNNVFHYCVIHEWFDILQLALSSLSDSTMRGKALNQSGNKNRTVLLTAAENEQMEMVEELLKYKEVNMTCTDELGNNVLHYCASHGWIRTLHAILQLITDIKTRDRTLNQKGYNDETVISKMARNGHKNEVDDLIKLKEISLTCADKNGDNLLHFCVRHKWRDTLQTVLERVTDSTDKGKMLNQKGSHGQTVILGAIDRGHRDVADELLKCDEIDMLCVDKDGNNILHYCYKLRWIDIIQDVLTRVLDSKDKAQMLNQKGKEEKTVILLASEKEDKETVEKLMKYKETDITCFDMYGSNLLHHCAHYGWLDILQHVLAALNDTERDAMLNENGLHERNVIHNAEFWGRKEIVQELLKYEEVVIKCTNYHDGNILHCCAENGWSDIIQDILRRLLDDTDRDRMLNKKGKNKQTVILTAANNRNNKEIVEILMKYKEVDIKCTDKYGENILHYCAEHGWSDILQDVLTRVVDSTERYQMLNQNGGYEKRTVILTAAEKRNKEIVEILMKFKEVDIKCTDKNSDNILHYCAEHGMTDILQHVLTRVVDSTERGKMLNQKNWYGRTVILRAADNGNKEIVEVLMKYEKVDIKCTDEGGENILNHCAKHGWTDILQQVLTRVVDSTERGQMLNHKDGYGGTVILRAADKGNKEIVEILMKYEEVDIKCTNEGGHNILHYCAKHGWSDILQYVLTRVVDSTERGQMLNQIAIIGRTAILTAAYHRNKEIVEILMKYKEVDLKCSDHTCHDIRYYCTQNGWTDIK